MTNRRPSLAGIVAAIVTVIFATVLAIIILAHTAQPTWPSKPIPTTPVFEQQAATPHNDLTDEDTSDTGLPPVSAASLAAACHGHTGMYHDTPSTWINCDQKPTKP